MLAACVVFILLIKASPVIISKYKLHNAQRMLESGNYEEAYALLEEIGKTDDIASSKYDRAVALIDSGDIVAAYDLLDGLNYKDSASKLLSIKQQYIKILLSKAKVGSYVYFGQYEQDNNPENGKEDIEWLVLAKDNNRILVVSRYALDCQPYNKSRADVTWQTCSLRKWLNNTFVGNAFSAEERVKIPTVTVRPDKNPNYGTNAGQSSRDQVFLLNLVEAQNYFSTDEARICTLTSYAAKQGNWEGNSNLSDGKITCAWWLRSPGSTSKEAVSVERDGSLRFGGYLVNTDDVSIRPALWINLGS